MTCRHFDDAIAVASYPLDIHHPRVAVAPWNGVVIVTIFLIGH